MALGMCAAPMTAWAQNLTMRQVPQKLTVTSSRSCVRRCRGPSWPPAARHQWHPALVQLAPPPPRPSPSQATTSTDSPPNLAHNEVTLPY